MERQILNKLLDRDKNYSHWASIVTSRPEVIVWYIYIVKCLKILSIYIHYYEISRGNVPPVIKCNCTDFYVIYFHNIKKWKKQKLKKKEKKRNYAVCWGNHRISFQRWKKSCICAFPCLITLIGMAKKEYQRISGSFRECLVFLTIWYAIGRYVIQKKVFIFYQ